MALPSPFVFGKHADGGFFTNRAEEIDHLKRNFGSCLSTILISPRRWGKSSLVNVAATQFQKQQTNVIPCFVDLYNIRDEEEFFKVYIREIISKTSGKWEERLAIVKSVFKKITPVVSFPVDAQSEFTLKINWEEARQHKDEILEMPEAIYRKKKIKLIICIDEFQNISYFDDPLAFQKKLRSHWQKQQNTTYCLYGSKRHLMMDFFSSPSMPFYKFGDLMFLKKIELEHWIKFITKRFKETRKEISEELAGEIALRVELHPYSVQQFANAVWHKTGKKANAGILVETLDQLLDHNSILFEREVENLTSKQLNFLKALIDGVKSLSAMDTLLKYNLGSSAYVVKIRKALEDKEVIDTMGRQIEFIDPLFKRWLRERYFKSSHDF